MSQHTTQQPFKIGDVFLAKKTTIRNTNFPQQSWYEDIEIPAGRYPVYATDVYQLTNEVVFNTVFIQFIGSVVEDYFPPTAFGYVIGPYDKKKNKNSISYFNQPIYSHTLANAVFYDEGRLPWMDTHLTVVFNRDYAPVRLTMWDANTPHDYLSVVRVAQ